MTSRAADTAVEAARVSRALAAWSAKHSPGVPQTEEFVRGMALAMRPAVEKVIAEARRIGRTPAQVQADLEAGLADAYRERGWEMT